MPPNGSAPPAQGRGADCRPSISDQGHYYDVLWNKTGQQLNAHDLARLVMILDYLRYALTSELGRPRTICELGCGRGWLSEELSKFGNVTGIDLSAEGIRMAKERYPLPRFERASILDYRPGNRFDLVISSEVIEHVEDQRGFMDTVSAILEPGGHFLITCPNRLEKKNWFDANPNRQLLENWLTPAELLALLPRNFKVLRRETFLLDFSHAGARRIFNSPRLMAGLEKIRCRGLYTALRSTLLSQGVYQILLAQRS